MPTNRRVRDRRRTGPGTIAPGLWHWLCGDEFDADRDIGMLVTFTRPHAELWLAHRAEVVAWFAANRPGERPPLFWRFETDIEAPRTRAAQCRYLQRHGLLFAGEVEADA